MFGFFPFFFFYYRLLFEDESKSRNFTMIARLFARNFNVYIASILTFSSYEFFFFRAKYIYSRCRRGGFYEKVVARQYLRYLRARAVYRKLPRYLSRGRGNSATIRIMAQRPLLPQNASPTDEPHDRPQAATAPPPRRPQNCRWKRSIPIRASSRRGETRGVL